MVPVKSTEEISQNFVAFLEYLNFIIVWSKKQMDKNLIKTNTVKGLKVALVHHLDMPIMRQTGFHISPGTENQIAITPTLLATTKVISRVFLLCQIWIVNYNIKSLSNNLSNETIKTGVSREMIFEKEFICLEDNRNTSLYVFITEII